MKLIVDSKQRYAKMRAHTATHLLHAELIKYFPNTKQAGSLVDSDLLRFDFYAERLLDTKELQIIESDINAQIYKAFPVELTETSFDEAQKLGAKAFFEEKYGDQVRVIRILDGENIVSAELCGGTHVSNTKEIGAFAIISQEAVASGIKRLTAITGPKVIEKLHATDEILQQLVLQLDIKSSSQIAEKIQKTLKEYEEIKSKLESIESSLVMQTLKSGEKKSNIDFDIIMQLPSTTNFKTLSTLVKQQITEFKSALFFSEEGNYLILTNGSVSAKDLLSKYNLKGGGSDVSAQGRDPQVNQIS